VESHLKGAPPAQLGRRCEQEMALGIAQTHNAAFAWLVRVAAIAMTVAACGGVTAVSSTRIGDGPDGSSGGTTSTGGANAGRSGSAGASGSISSGGSAGAFPLVACNDGSGESDCCSPGVDFGTPCKAGSASCFTPCTPDGWRTVLFCNQGALVPPPGAGTQLCPGTTACNDGTGNTDCCWASARPGETCFNIGLRCSLGCRNGFTGYRYCDGSNWTAGQGLFACGADGG
jgi:hypothetical protein